MIWLHIGMPKAGSSSLQDYLQNNYELLNRYDLHYMRTGRTWEGKISALPSHNTLAKQMIRNWAGVDQSLFDEYVRECRVQAGKSCIISGEMFFSHRLRPLQDRIFCRIDQPVNVVVYLRRFSEFLESDYKQKAKKGRQFLSAVQYARNAVRSVGVNPVYLNFSSILRNIQADIPNSVIHPRIFLREKMSGGDIITDFLHMLGVPLAQISLPAKRSNRSLSRISSEALGLFAERDSGINMRAHRKMDAALQNSEFGEFFAKGDVFLPEEAAEIDERLELANRDVLDHYFPGEPRLFPKIENYARDYMRGDPSELDRFKSVVRELLKIRNSI